MPKYTVIIDWTDHDVLDADEFQVFASDPAAAIAAAKKRWRLSVAEWPGIRMRKVWLPSQAAQA